MARLVWIVLAVAYAAFVGWYTNWSGPLSAAEIDAVVARMSEEGSPEGVERLRRFLESDTGDDFVMVNVIDSPEKPAPGPGIGPDDTTDEVLGRYMAHMWPELLKRACHPVMGGSAAAEALDIWGIDGAERWSQAGMMRYRSRRDMVEIATDPAFQGPHEFKIAAMTKTIAFPIDPWFQLGDPRLVLGLVFFGIASGTSLLARR